MNSPPLAVHSEKILALLDGPPHLHQVELFQEWHPEPTPIGIIYKKERVMKKYKQ